LYVTKVKEFPALVMIMVGEKMAQFSSEQVRKAEAAYTLLKNAGHQSPSELINLVNDGNTRDMPTLQQEDIL
jgi:hypothetical protein